MASDSEHTIRSRPPQQAQGRNWPVVVLLLGVATLALALTACGGSSSTSTPGATSAPEDTNATGATEWDTTNNFSAGGEGEYHYEEFYAEQCAQVTFQVTASVPVSVSYQDPSAEDPPEPGTQTVWQLDAWEEGTKVELSGTITTWGEGYGLLEIANYGGYPGKAEGTISYRVDPPTSGTTC